MKRITKLLAMGMALALTFGMTVSAAGEVVDPSPVIPPTVGTEGGVASGYTESQGKVVADQAFDKVADTKALNNKLGINLLEGKVVEVFDLAVNSSDGAKVTYNGSMPGNALEKEYGYGWGYALVHFSNARSLGDPTVTLMNKDDSNTFSATVKASGTYAVMSWRRQVVAEGSNGHGLSVDRWYNGGYGRDSYQEEHTAARKAIEVDGYGTAIAESYNTKYVFAKTMGSVVLNLNEDSTVQFNNLEDLEYGEAYLVLCYNDLENISGVPNRHFALTKVGEGAYNAKMPKGTYMAVVIKVTTDATKVPAQPPIEVSAPTTSAGVADGSTTAGVVSPKTGEMLPVAVILAAICLAGAAVCAKKARTNA